MEKTKKTNSLGFGYIIASFVFLFNPNIIVFDILPDFIGFFLLGMGLVKLADIMPRFADVRESFIKLGWISLAKFLSIFLLYIMPVNEIATFGLVLTFSFAIVDLLFLIPAWNGFFEGMIYLATRKDGHVIFYRKNNHSKSITEKLKSFTILFFIIKETVIIMPELTSLSTYDAIGRVDYYVIDIRYFVNYFRILASIIVIVFGIIWLCRMVSYIRKIKKDVPFVERVLAVYNEEVAPNKDLFLRRRIKAALITLCFAFGFGVDFYVLDINMLPDFLSAALFICGFALLYKYVKRSKIAIAAAALYGVVSLAVWGYTLYFAENFDITHIDKVYDVYEAYRWLCLGTFFEALAFFAFVIVVYFTLSALVKEHTGYVLENELSDYSRRQRDEEKKLIKKRLVEAVVISALAAASSVVYHILVINVEFIWMINFVIALICALMWGTRLNLIYEHVEEKYDK